MSRHISNEKNRLLRICNTLILLRRPRHNGRPRPHSPPMHRILPAFSLLTLLVSAPAWADDAGLKRCRGMADATARLACYDALPLGGEAAPASARTSPVPVPPPAAPAAPPARALEGRFGLEYQAAAAAQLDSIQSQIPGLFEGWRPNERIRLANGQVWQVADESTSLLQRRDPKVTVRRGALGAFYLDIDGDNRSPRVRRVQ